MRTKTASCHKSDGYIVRPLSRIRGIMILSVMFIGTFFGGILFLVLCILTGYMYSEIKWIPTSYILLVQILLLCAVTSVANIFYITRNRQIKQIYLELFILWLILYEAALLHISSYALRLFPFSNLLVYFNGGIYCILFLGAIFRLRKVIRIHNWRNICNNHRNNHRNNNI